MHSRRFISLLSVVLFITTVTVAPGVSVADVTNVHPSPLVHRGARLTNTSVGPGTQIDAVDMITSSFGYGVVANNAFNPTRWVYLVRTTDAGSSWSMQSALPYLSFHQSGESLVPTVDFVSRRVGYALSEGTVPGALYMTTNAGITWSKVATPGVSPSFMATSTTLAVVSYLCVHPHQDSDFNLCPNDMSLYRIGATTPWRVVRIPRTSNVANRDAQLFAIPAPNTFVISEGQPGGGGEHSRLSLSETNNAGTTWRHLDDPCAGLGSDQLVTYSARRWLLSCFLGVGMNQGIGNLWLTQNAANSWSRIRHGTTEATTLTLSENRRILFGEVGGATGGIVYSTDGGADWIRTDIDGQGGAPESLSVIGATGALDDVLGGLIYRTSNDRVWSALPELPAGTHKGTPICTARGGVTATFQWKPLKAAIGPSRIIFTNRGTRNCYLDAAPIVQPVDGPANTPVGPPADMTFQQSDFVILKAHGGRANTSLLIFPTDSYKPASTCGARIATGMTIRFGSPSHFYKRFHVPTDVCTKFSTAQVVEVLPGLSTHFTIN